MEADYLKHHQTITFVAVEAAAVAGAATIAGLIHWDPSLLPYVVRHFDPQTTVLALIGASVVLTTITLLLGWIVQHCKQARKRLLESKLDSTSGFIAAAFVLAAILGFLVGWCRVPWPKEAICFKDSDSEAVTGRVLGISDGWIAVLVDGDVELYEADTIEARISGGEHHTCD